MAESTASTAVSEVTTIKVPSDLATHLRIIAVHRGMSIDEVADKYLRSAIEKEHAKVLNERRRKDSGEAGV